MAEPEAVSNEVSADTALGKFAFKGALNTLATVATLIIVCVMSVFLYQHVAQAAARDDVLAKAFDAFTQAQREQNCLIAIPEAQREMKAEFCKRVTR